MAINKKKGSISNYEAPDQTPFEKTFWIFKELIYTYFWRCGMLWIG